MKDNGYKPPVGIFDDPIEPYTESDLQSEAEKRIFEKYPKAHWWLYDQISYPDGDETRTQWQEIDDENWEIYERAIVEVEQQVADQWKTKTRVLIQALKDYCDPRAQKDVDLFIAGFKKENEL